MSTVSYRGSLSLICLVHDAFTVEYTLRHGHCLRHCQAIFFFCIQVRDNFSYGYKSISTRWVFDEDPAYEHIGVTEYVNDH